MIDLQKLEDERRDAETDKAELFDFYHQNFSKLTEELRRIYAAWQAGHR
jgi:hypothetical protein